MKNLFRSNKTVILILVIVTIVFIIGISISSSKAKHSNKNTSYNNKLLYGLDRAENSMPVYTTINKDNTHDVSIYIPDTEPTPVTCMESLGGYVNKEGKCEYKNYKPFLQYPHAMATNYCQLEVPPGSNNKTQPSGCSGAIGDPRGIISEIKKNIFDKKSPDTPPLGFPNSSTRFGVTANPPMMIGNSAEGINLITKEQVKNTYQGATEKSGICYDVEGPGGRAILIPADRCAGYCLSNCDKGPRTDKSTAEECGPCVGAINKNPTPNPPCVGKVDGMYTNCRGISKYGCTMPTVNECDWCASQNHPHFDLDNVTFDTVCRPDEGDGSCELTKVIPFRCSKPNEFVQGGGSKKLCEECDSSADCISGNCSWWPIDPSECVGKCSVSSKKGCCISKNTPPKTHSSQPQPQPQPQPSSYVNCPEGTWDTGGLNCNICPGSCIKPGDENWPNSSTANHYCCNPGLIPPKTHSSQPQPQPQPSSYIQCPVGTWDTGGLNCDSCPPSNPCIKPGDETWPNSSTANHYCCKS